MLQQPPIIDMRPDGSFRAPPRGNAMFTTKVALGAMLVTVVGGALLMAAAMVWLVSMILPAVLIAGGVAFLALKVRGWQVRRTTAEGPLRRF